MTTRKSPAPRVFAATDTPAPSPFDSIIQAVFFGGCPHCKNNDGYRNVGREQWFYCREHRMKWLAGDNIFSSWLDETEEQQRRNFEADGFGSFEVIEPVYPIDDRLGPNGEPLPVADNSTDDEIPF